MCAIIGMVGEPGRDEWSATHWLLSNLLVAAEVRGRDATGFVAITQPLKGNRTRSAITDKLPIPASEFVTESNAWRKLRQMRANIVLGHCRLTTSGSPLYAVNNHPHVSDDGRFALVHNGVLPRHREIADRHCLSLRSDCDSEILLRMMEKAPRAVDGLGDCLRASASVRGSMAVAVLDTLHNVVWLCRDDDRPLWLCRVKDMKPWLFASTAEILMTALEMSYGRQGKSRIELLLPLASNHPTALTPTGLLISPAAKPVGSV